MLFDILKYRDWLSKYNINIIYSGPIWSDGIETFGETVRKRLALDETPFSTSQAVFSIFVEQMNNMLMYSVEKERIELPEGGHSTASKGVFVFGASDKTYFIQCGNTIKNESIEMLKSKIDYLNSLDKAGLRQYYKDQIKSKDNNPESKGAGLGLIEIARRASSKIEYSFTPLDSQLSFFALFVSIEQEVN